MLTTLAIIFALVPYVASAHQGHAHAPKGPYKVVKQEAALIPCAGLSANFQSRYDKVTLELEKDPTHSYSILTERKIRFKTGTVVNPTFTVDHCEGAVPVKCNVRGQPLKKHDRRDFFCAGRFNYVVEKAPKILERPPEKTKVAVTPKRAKTTAPATAPSKEAATKEATKEPTKDLTFDSDLDAVPAAPPEPTPVPDTIPDGE